VSEKPKRRFQFSIKALLAVTAAAALGLGIWSNWKAVGGILIFLLTLLGVLVLIMLVRLAILWALSGLRPTEKDRPR
jgi:hypothetical protein